MEYKDLSPEDKELVDTEMRYTRSVIINIAITNVLVLALLTFLNVTICKYNNFPKDALFFIQFLTSLLIGFGCAESLNQETNRFAEEVRKIIKK